MFWKGKKVVEEIEQGKRKTGDKSKLRRWVIFGHLYLLFVLQLLKKKIISKKIKVPLYEKLSNS